MESGIHKQGSGKSLQVFVSALATIRTIVTSLITQSRCHHHPIHLVLVQVSSTPGDAYASNGMSHLLPTVPGRIVHMSTYAICATKTQKSPTSIIRQYDVQTGFRTGHKGHSCHLAELSFPLPCYHQ